MTEEINFKCRICGCTKYKGVYGDSIMVPLGGRMYPMAYQCAGCSVVFKDLEKFSADKTKKQIPEQKTESFFPIDWEEKEWLNEISKKLINQKHKICLK